MVVHGPTAQWWTIELRIIMTSNKIYVMMTGHIITRISHHIKQMPVPTEQFLCDEIIKEDK